MLNGRQGFLPDGFPDARGGGVEQEGLHPIAGLLRRWKLVLLCAALPLLAALLFIAVRPPTYTATTDLLIYNRELHSGPEPVVAPGPADIPLVENMVQIFRSRGVLTRVIGALDLSRDPEFVSPPTLARVAEQWIGTRADPAPGDERVAIERALASFGDRLSVARTGTSHAVGVSFRASDPYKAALVANEIARTASRIIANADSGASRAPMVKERLQGLGPSASVISAADPPVFADGPRSIVILLGALGVGLGVGVVLAVLLEFLDRSIRSAGQLEHAFDLECLGVIPRLVDVSGGNHPGEATGGPASSTARQALSGLCQALRRTCVVIQSVRDLHVIGIVSADRGSGTTTIAARVAYACAHPGRRVLFLKADGDGRSVLPAAGPVRTAGAAQAGGTGNGVAAAGEGTRIDVLSVTFPRGEQLEPSTLSRLEEVVNSAKTSYDLVIVDLPSLASGPEAQLAAPFLDGLLLVVRWGCADADMIERRLAAFGRARTKFFGAVLNMADPRLIGRYGDLMSAAEAALAKQRVAAHVG